VVVETVEALSRRDLSVVVGGGNNMLPEVENGNKGALNVAGSTTNMTGASSFGVCKVKEWLENREEG